MRAIVAMAAIGLAGSVACADGCFVEPTAISDRAEGKTGVASTEQKGVIIELPEGREALLLQTTYHGPAGRFAWVIPVPGKPSGDDVFLAEPAFIEELLTNTAPQVETKIIDPRQRMRSKAAGEAVPPFSPGTDEGGVEPAAVTVHERLEVGDFDATILSATGAEVLTQWLQRNGYRVPDDSANVFGHYVEKQWYFVALRMQPAAVEERPLLEDVDPIGIRFGTEELLYPLCISRASSRQKTALTLLVLSERPIDCQQFGEAVLPIGPTLSKGMCYAAVRRELVEGAQSAAVCEYRGPWGMPFVDMYYKAETRVAEEGRSWRAADLWTTRYWTLLDLEQLEDLTFSPSPNAATRRLEIFRRGTIHVPLSERLRPSENVRLAFYVIAAGLVFLLAARAARRGWAPPVRPLAIGGALALPFALGLVLMGPMVGLALLMVGPLLIAFLATVGGKGSPATLSRSEMIRGTLVVLGAAAVGFVALRLLSVGDHYLWEGGPGEVLADLWSGKAHPGASLLSAALQVAWIGLTLHLVHGNLGGAGGRAGWLAAPLSLMACLVLVSEARTELLRDLFSDARPWQPALVSAPVFLGHASFWLSGLAFLVLLVLLAHLFVAPWVCRPPNTLVRLLAFALLATIAAGMVFSVVGLSLAHAGTGGYLPSGAHQLDRGLQLIDALMVEFHDRYGCYPAQLKDILPAAHPEQGVDSSGNLVTVAVGEALSRSADWDYVRALPEDPLTGANDTWLYEPTGSPMVDSGGYEITLRERQVTSPRELTDFMEGRLHPLYDPATGRPMLYWPTAEAGPETGLGP